MRAFDRRHVYARTIGTWIVVVVDRQLCARGVDVRARVGVERGGRGRRATPFITFSFVIGGEWRALRACSAQLIDGKRFPCRAMLRGDRRRGVSRPGVGGFSAGVEDARRTAVGH